MGVSPEPTVAETDNLRRYLAVVEQGDWRTDEIRALREALTLALGGDHPALIKAEMVIRRREALAR